MTGPAYAEELEVNTAEFGNGGFITAALGLEVGRLAIGQMRVSRVRIDVPEKVFVHKVPVGTRVLRRQADVFVQVEGAAQ